MGSPVLARPPALVVTMGERAGDREAGDRRGLHRAGFRGYWRFLSPHRPGRPKISPELRHLIRSMTAENPTWGAPRIHGELLKLGLEISESTVSRYLAQGASPRDSGQRWLTFLKNHREAIAAMDFFTVPTATFRVLYCF